MDFSKRSYQKELLDGNYIPFEDIQTNLKELNIINSLLGGHNITLKGIRSLLPSATQPLHILEIGCGGGDNLAFLAKKLKKYRNITFTGIDIKESCIAFAQEQYPQINFVCSDYQEVTFSNKADIIFSSLFCHHFTDEALISQFIWLNKHAHMGFVINDLQRHPLAYYSIKFLTGLFSKSYLVKNDAPLSVARGFRKQELKQLLDTAGIKHYSLKWVWAFRYLVISSKT